MNPHLNGITNVFGLVFTIYCILFMLIHEHRDLRFHCVLHRGRVARFLYAYFTFHKIKILSLETNFRVKGEVLECIGT